MSQTQNSSGAVAMLSLFEAFGIELEYMIVDRDSLQIQPITDKLFFGFAGEYTGDIVDGPISLNNELAAHVVEFKTTEPASDLKQLPERFNAQIRKVNEALGDNNAQLMPSAMHPWMDSLKEMRLWPHGSAEIYDTLHRIFDCRGHGWANLQSTHINLPFANEEEFVRLHAAIRLVLPLIPSLAASSPFADGRSTGFRDTRLDTYKNNQRKVPSVSGHVIPEVCRSFQDYHDFILNRIYRDMESHDPEGILRFEWINSRGAIARFDRNAIEIRLVDVQETPAMDLAIVSAITGLVQALTEERWAPLQTYHTFSPERLRLILDQGIRFGEDAIIEDEDYLRIFGWKSSKHVRAGDFWGVLIQNELALYPAFQQGLELILSEGTLATRIVKAVGRDVNKTALHRTYDRLCQCLALGEPFVP